MLKLTKLWMFLSVTLLSVAFLYLSQVVFFAHSEIWAVNVSQMSILSAFQHSILIYKLIFTSLIKVSYWFGLNDIQMFLFNRFVFAAIGLLTLSFAYQISKIIFKSKYKSLLVILFILTTNVFLVRGFRIRSDHLAMLFHILSTLYLLRLKLNKVRPQKSSLKVFIALELLAFLSTPKAIILNISNLVLINILWPKYKFINFDKDFRFFTALLKKHKVISIVLSLLLIPVVIKSYNSVFEYFVRTLQGEKENAVAYFSRDSFMFYIKYAYENPWYAIPLMASVFWPLINKFSKYRSDDPLKKAWWAKCYVLVLGLIFIPDKLPFLLSSYLPILYIMLMLFLSDIYEFLVGINKNFTLYARSIVALFCVAITINAFGWVEHFGNWNTNKIQKKAIEQVSSYLSQYPRAMYFDGMGMVPNQNQFIEYVGYAENEIKEHVFGKIQKVEPDFIVYNKKVSNFGDKFMSYLHNGYLHLGSNLWCKAYTFMVGEDEPFEPNYNYKGRLYFKYSMRKFLWNMRKKFSVYSENSSQIFIYKTTDIDVVDDSILVAKTGEIRAFIQGSGAIDLKEYDYVLLPENPFFYRATVFSNPFLALEVPFDKLFEFDSRF